MQTKLYISDKTSIQITYRNPMFSNQGTASLPLQLPGANAQKLLHPHNLNKRAKTSFAADINFAGSNLFRGKLEIEETTNNDIQGFFASGKGEFASIIKDRYLTDYGFQHLYCTYDNRDNILDEMTNFTKFYPEKQFVFFPFYAPDCESQPGSITDCDIVNCWDSTNLVFDRKTPVNNIEPYHFAPAYYLCFVLKTLFSAYGYNIVQNFLYEHTELRQVVISNINTEHYHTIFEAPEAGYYITFARDLPKILVSDFIKSIENRFACKFFINDLSKEVKIISLASIILDTSYTDFTNKLLKGYKINHQKITGITFKDNNTVSDKLFINITSEVDMPHLLPDLNSHIFYLVKSENQVYERVYDEESTIWKWQPYCYYEPEYCDGDNPETIETKSGTLQMIDVSRTDYRLLPTSDVTRKKYPEIITNESLNFLIYRGLMPFDFSDEIKFFADTYSEMLEIDLQQNNDLCYVFSDDKLYRYYTSVPGWVHEPLVDISKKYPYASSSIYYISYDDYVRTPYNISVKLNGTNGLIENFWKEYIYWLLNIYREITVGLDLSVKDIQNIAI